MNGCTVIAIICFLIYFKMIHASEDSLDSRIPYIKVSNANALVDEPVSIQIEGLDPFQEIELVAQAKDASGELWESRVQFRADRSGNISLDEVAPIAGSYEGIDGMGLFWSMQSISKNSSSFKLPEGPIDIALKLIRNNQEVSATIIRRFWSISGVKKIVVREEGLVGTLFVPQVHPAPPVVITLNGSNGGINENRAELLATHGFAVFTLGYFGMDGLPAELANIPLEYFEKAFSWLKKRTDLNGEKIAVLGASRGGELALILGSWFPKSIKAIVSLVPSSVIYGGSPEGGSPMPAWLYKGMPLAQEATIPDFEPKAGVDREHAIWLTSYFLKGMENNPKGFEKAAIPVENIVCPVLLISGGDDQMWPSSLYSEQIKARIAKGTAASVHLDYPKAGHLIGVPFLPAPNAISQHHVDKLWYYMGGSAKDDELAKQDSWPKMIQFLKDNLGV